MPQSLTEEQFRVKHQSEVEIAKQELYRKSRDVIRVYNPLDHTFAFMQEGYWHRVPAHTEKDMPRYMANHFFKKICDFMIGEQIKLKGEALKALREQQMGHEFLDKYEENVQVWDKTPSLSDPDLIDQVRKRVILGVVEEYGMEEPEMVEERVNEKPLDYRSVHEQVFEKLDHVSKDYHVKEEPKKKVLAKEINVQD